MIMNVGLAYTLVMIFIDQFVTNEFTKKHEVICKYLQQIYSSHEEETLKPQVSKEFQSLFVRYSYGLGNFVVFILSSGLKPPPHVFESTCEYARWALMHHFLSVCHLT